MTHNNHLSDKSEEPPLAIDDLIDATQAEAKLGLNNQQCMIMDDLDRLSCGDLSLSNGMIDICGVMAGIKPAALVSCDNQSIDLIAELGLCIEGTNHRSAVTISHSRDLARRLVEEFRSTTEETDGHEHRIIGKILGYPETATEYFLKRMPTVLQSTELQLPMVQPVELENKVRRHFSQLVLSPEFWREELNDYVIPLEDATRELAPRTYRQFARRTRKDNAAKLLGKLIGKPVSDFGPDIALSKVE